MSHNKLSVQAVKKTFPQIYAFILPKYIERKGWVKIGYTTRRDVDVRIKEQTRTAAVAHSYSKLWSAPAKFKNNDKWFTDKAFHKYLRNIKGIEQDPDAEWFLYKDEPYKSFSDFNDFINGNYEQAKETLTYELRDEQTKAVEMALSCALENEESEFLWNAKPRFGKTLCAYDLARELEAARVLIVTNRPAIGNSWFDDFEKFIAWQTEYAFVSTSDSLKERAAITREEYLDQIAHGKKDLIAFISLQDLKGAISFGGKLDKLKWVKDIEWDMLVIDEAHEGIDTFKTDIAFDNISRKFTLHLSGTPFKAVASGKFNEDEIFNWTYADEQYAKATWNNPEENNPYEKLPQLNMYSYQMSQMITDKVNKGAQIEDKNIDYAFDLNEFFDTNNKGKFVHQTDVKKWLDTLTQNEKYPFSTKELRNELKHTFWLLNRVASAKALQKLLQNHPVFENYKIILAAGDGQGHDDEQIISDKAIDRVKEAIKTHDKTITLSVGQLTTGITVPEWTAVLMLSNLKSPSLYMQAAFRAQNPWEYEVEGQIYQKQNAYIFDFAPERTLIIYEEFANNLSRRTAGGNGTSYERKENIKQLLNFFPVIAEDNEGKMIELDATQVLTIPKAIKAQEVVRRGFMSNLLFQNISGIFASSEVKAIIELLTPVEQGKPSSRQKSKPIETEDIHVDETGNVSIPESIVISETDAHFGEKVYGDLVPDVDESTEDVDLSKVISDNFIENTEQSLKELAKEKGVSTKVAEQIARVSAEKIAREAEVITEQAKIKQMEAEVAYKKELAEAFNNGDKANDVEARYKEEEARIEEEYQKELKDKIDKKAKELEIESIRDILEEAEEKKKNTVEGDVRARLRGFSRTIPSFLMAYGDANTSLQSFDNHINDNVFKEVTGITLEQFRTLRDTYNFFDEMVFNESVKEFLDKRQELANYFDESQNEDIFDYIPNQETNQIFTPKQVVKMMLDKLEAEEPYIFTDPNKTFADLYMKSGLYIAEVVKRLYIGLENQIPDPNTRLKHILENQVYGFAPTEIIYNIARNYIFGFDERAKTINDSHIVCLDTLPYAKDEYDFTKKLNELFGGDK